MQAIRPWLEGLGLAQYADAFEAEELEAQDLRDLEEADLERLDLPMGPRKRLLRAIAELAEAEGRSRSDEARHVSSGRARHAVPAELGDKIERARARIEGERKQVTVLFADVKSSTQLLEHLDPEEVGSLQDASSCPRTRLSPRSSGMSSGPTRPAGAQPRPLGHGGWLLPGGFGGHQMRTALPRGGAIHPIRSMRTNRTQLGPPVRYCSDLGVRAVAAEALGRAW